MSDQRRHAVVARIIDAGGATYVELAEEFGVSEMTARRDLKALEARGLIHMVRGGAIPVVGRSYEPPISEREHTAAPAKAAIGRAAARLLSDGETAILDVGTTPLALARELAGHRRLTVVTPSILVACELRHSPDIRTLLTGGVMRPGEMSLIGHRAEQSFVDLNCDTFFLSVGGVDVERGLTEFNLDDTQIKQAAMRAARRRVLLADQSKFGRVAFATVAQLTDIDVLVTDAREDDPVVLAAAEESVEIVHATPQEQS